MFDPIFYHTDQTKSMLTTKATTSPKVLERKATQKRKIIYYEAKDNIFKGLEGFAQTLLKIEEIRSQTMFKLEVEWGDRELTIIKWKLETNKR